MLFRDWLAGQMQAKDLTNRALARRLAEQHPEGATEATVDTYRRSIRRYLNPNDPYHIKQPELATRAAFAEALGVDLDEVPASDDDEDEDLDVTLQALAREQTMLAREQRDLSRRLERVLQQAVAR